jgi:hypothetical protein
MGLVVRVGLFALWGLWYEWVWVCFMGIVIWVGLCLLYGDCDVSGVEFAVWGLCQWGCLLYGDCDVSGAEFALWGLWYEGLSSLYGDCDVRGWVCFMGIVMWVGLSLLYGDCDVSGTEFALWGLWYEWDRICFMGIVMWVGLSLLYGDCDMSGAEFALWGLWCEWGWFCFMGIVMLLALSLRIYIGLDDGGIGVRSQPRARNLSLIHSVQTGCRTYLASTPINTGRSFSRGKAVAAWSILLTWFLCRD